MDDHLPHHLHLNHKHHAARKVAHAQDDSLPAFEAPTPIVATPARILPRDSSTSTCTDTTSPGCVLPESASNNTATIIGVSVAIPLVGAIIVLWFLHRRLQKRQAAEDARDAQADLDFGIDPKFKNAGPVKGRGRKGGPEMTAQDMGLEKNLRSGHGTGMSIDLGNPYMLPPGMNGSRDSLHSLTRSLQDGHDPYRMVGQQTPSIRGGFNDNGSIMSGSDRGLIANTQPNPMSRSHSPMVAGPGGNGMQRKPVPAPEPVEPVAAMPTFDFTDHTASDARVSQHSHHSQHSHITNKSVDVGQANRLSNQDKSLPATPADVQTPPPRSDSKSPYSHNNNAGPVDPYEFQEVVVPPSPEPGQQPAPGNGPSTMQEYDANNFPYPPPPEPAENANRMTLGLGLDLAGNRLSVLRPLPPDDPNDTAESRANRIRSFYKEYFSTDDAHAYDAGGYDYYEDYGDEYLQDGAVFDPDSGQFIVAQAPYAEPVTRRAMTPPPRGPPQKFRGGPRRPGHMSNGSSPGMGGRSRAFSNASYSRMGPGFGPRGRAPGKRPLPPPSALNNLPTPAMLKEGDFNLAADFAPPSSMRDRAAGRSDSPLLGQRPYALQTPIAQSPLASSFTELAVVPSPHMLRKSGTFTGLDFVPPPRFKDPDSGSDAGSIRSGRSNVSGAVSRQQQNAIRAGAYRLSRVPKNMVGTKDELMAGLKPQWNMGA